MVREDVLRMVGKAQKGDRSAYGRLVEMFQPTVYALALSRLRNPTEAEELVQEVFIHAMTKLDQLRDPNCFAGWLRQIAERMALNRLTRRGRVQGAESGVLENVESEGSTPLEDLVRSEAKEALWDGLDQLKPLDRETLVAFYIQGRSIEQMSGEFETPVGTIKRRLHVARNRLRERLEVPRKTAPQAPRAARQRLVACV